MPPRKIAPQRASPAKPSTGLAIFGGGGPAKSGAAISKIRSVRGSKAQQKLGLEMEKLYAWVAKEDDSKTVTSHPSAAAFARNLGIQEAAMSKRPAWVYPSDAPSPPKKARKKKDPTPPKEAEEEKKEEEEKEKVCEEDKPCPAGYIRVKSYCRKKIPKKEKKKKEPPTKEKVDEAPPFWASLKK